MYNIMNKRLPKEALNLILQFDRTYKEQFDKIIKEINNKRVFEMLKDLIDLQFQLIRTNTRNQFQLIYQLRLYAIFERMKNNIFKFIKNKIDEKLFNYKTKGLFYYIYLKINDITMKKLMFIFGITLALASCTSQPAETTATTTYSTAVVIDTV